MSNCVVPFCSSDKRKTKGIKFHEFPSNLDVRQKWIISIARKDPKTGGLWTPTDASRVCGLHFAPENYKTVPSGKRLLPDAIPTVFKNYPSYMQNRLFTKEYRRKQKSQDTVQTLSSKANIVRINLNQILQMPSNINNSPVFNEESLENQNSCPSSSYNVIQSNIEGTQNSEVNINNIQNQFIDYKTIEKCNNFISESNEKVQTSPIMSKENQSTDISNDDNNTVLAAVILPIDQAVKVHKVKSVNKPGPVKKYITNCACDPMYKTKLESCERLIRRLRSTRERLKCEKAELSSSLKRANCLLKTYHIEKLQEGIEDEDATAFIIKKQLDAFGKKKRDW